MSNKRPNPYVWFPRDIALMPAWSRLSHVAQWLYLAIQLRRQIMPGVYDVSFRRLALTAETMNADAVRSAAVELAEAGLAVVDERSEEVFLRRFFDFDTATAYKNLGTHVANALAEVASPDVRAAVGVEWARLRDEKPGATWWTSQRLQEVMDRLDSVPSGAFIDEDGAVVVGYEWSGSNAGGTE